MRAVARRAESSRARAVAGEAESSRAGIALWRAGVDRSLLWFVLMFVLNTLGILKIVYIFAISRPKRARAASGEST